MEAIIELFAALFAALFESLVGLLGAVVALVFAAIEFLFLVLTKGLSTASHQYAQRRTNRADRLTAAKQTAESGSDDNVPAISRKQSAIITSIAVCLIASGFAVWVIRDRNQQQRIETTRQQVNRLAETFANQLKDARVPDPLPGNLRDRDAWQQPIELFIDKTLLGSLIVVRSSGPDHATGTADDILGTQIIRAPAQAVGGELANRGMKALRERAAKLLPNNNEEPFADLAAEPIPDDRNVEGQ